ncbi:MAG: NEW3 domain-containing protein, partial [Kiritimatiellae bacterium]|nr:NEW3 domain-containing protein [Kiritimatiellia bacterium]
RAGTPARDRELAEADGSGRLFSTGEGTAMRWAAMWDRQQGLYLGIEDPRYEDYRFFYGGDRSGGATLATWQRTLVKPRSAWKSGTFRLALTGGGWHEAAGIYRDYVARSLKPNDVHPYVKWLVDAWCEQRSDNAQHIGWDMLQAGGETLMAANRQGVDGADASYCSFYPYPAPAWGTTREFSQKLAVRRALGGLYISYLDTHLSPSSGALHRDLPRIVSFPKSRLPADALLPDYDWYLRNAAYRYDGSCRSIEKNQSTFTVGDMAMGAREWRKWITDWTVDDLRFGTDGRYFDQLNLIYNNGRLYPDYDTYGCWVQGTLDFLTHVRKAARARNPYFTTAGEVCNDIFGQHTDLHMTSGVFNRLDLFQYCLPRQILIDGAWNVGLGYGGPNRMRFVWQVGARFQPEPEDARLLSLRRAVKSLLYDATYRDSLGIALRDAAGQPIVTEHRYVDSLGLKCQNAPTEGVTALWFLVNQGGQRGAIVNLVNAPVRKGATCAIRTTEFGPVAAARAVTIDGTWLPVAGRQEGNTFVFPVPEADCSSVILAGQMAPLVEWNIDPACAPGVIRKLTLKLTNPNADALSGSATMRLPRGWKAPAAVKFGPIASGESQSFAITLTVPEQTAKGRADIWCDIVTPSGAFQAYSLLVVNDPVVADFRGDPGSYHVWLKNLTTQPLTGTLGVSGRDGLRVSAPPDFSLPPETEVKVPVGVTGQDKLRELSELTATVKVGRQTLELVRAVMPTVPNGDFEIDSAGDGMPDWWFCRGAGDVYAYGRIRLAGEAHSGKTCLQIDPPPSGEKHTCAFPVHSAFKPNTRYRVSLWLKTANAEGVSANVGGVWLAGKGETGSAWRQRTAEFTTGATVSGLYRTLYNASDAPAYFDDFKVEEIGAAK